MGHVLSRKAAAPQGGSLLRVLAVSVLVYLSLVLLGPDVCYVRDNGQIECANSGPSLQTPTPPPTAATSPSLWCANQPKSVSLLGVPLSMPLLVALGTGVAAVLLSSVPPPPPTTTTAARWAP